MCLQTYCMSVSQPAAPPEAFPSASSIAFGQRCGGCNVCWPAFVNMWVWGQVHWCVCLGDLLWRPRDAKLAPIHSVITAFIVTLAVYCVSRCISLALSSIYELYLSIQVLHELNGPSVLWLEERWYVCKAPTSLQYDIISILWTTVWYHKDSWGVLWLDLIQGPMISFGRFVSIEHNQKGYIIYHFNMFWHFYCWNVLLLNEEQLGRDCEV